MDLLDLLEPALRDYRWLYAAGCIGLAVSLLFGVLIGHGIALADPPDPEPDPDPATQPMPAIPADPLAAWEHLFTDRPTVPLSRREMTELDKLDRMLGGAA